MSRTLPQKLTDKKFREKSGLFIVEGKKSIEELLRSDFVVKALYLTPQGLADLQPAITGYEKRAPHGRMDILTVSASKLSEYGTLEKNETGIAVVEQNQGMEEEALLSLAKTNLVLVLDDIRDPGNLGTIIRTADWFGVSHIIASQETVDVWNPKVIAATMGSFTRVKVNYLPLQDLLGEAQSMHIPIYGTFLEGTSVDRVTPPRSALIVMGSESHGIDPSIASLIEHHITIPRRGNAESLNVGVAMGIILNTFRA